MIFRRVTFAMEEREWIDSSDDLKLTIGLEMHVFVIFLALFLPSHKFHYVEAYGKRAGYYDEFLKK